MAHRTPATYQDLLNAPALAELIDGEIHHRASPRGTHGRAQAQVSAAVVPADHGGADGWWILVEPDVRLRPDRVLRPDVAGWRRARLQRVPETAIDLVPDWVCEVLSPGHLAYDLVMKRRIYAEHGLRWLWTVHPESRLLEAFELRDARWVLRGAYTDGALEPVPPFPFPIDVARLFLPPDGPLSLAEAEAAYRAP